MTTGKELEEAEKRFHPTAKRGRRGRVRNTAAYEAGVRDGQNINIRPGVGQQRTTQAFIS